MIFFFTARIARAHATGLANDLSCIFVLIVSSGIVRQVSTPPATAPAKKASPLFFFLPWRARPRVSQGCALTKIAQGRARVRCPSLRTACLEGDKQSGGDLKDGRLLC